MGYGVRSQGVELEASVAADARPARSMLGLTYADTNIATNLVGNDDGAPLNQALRSLPGASMSNAPKIVVDRRARLDSADRRHRPVGPVLRRCALQQRLQHRLRPVPAEGAGQLHAWSTPASASAGRTTAGRSSCGRRTCSTRIISRSRSTRRSRQARRRAAPRSSIRSIPGGRQIFSAFLAEPRTYGLTLRAQVRGAAARAGRSSAAAAAAAAAAAGDADLRGRLGDPGDGGLPGSAAAAAAAAAGAGARLIAVSD